MTKRSPDEAAKDIHKLKDELGRRTLENAARINNDTNTWYIALTGACFTAGTIAITLSADKSIAREILHPKLFWGGALLLILNGAIVFLFLKLAMESDDRSSVNLRVIESKMWQFEKVLDEVQGGNNKRAHILSEIQLSEQSRLLSSNHKWKWIDWTWFILKALRIDFAYALALFPVLFMCSQVIDKLNITYSFYKQALLFIALIYVIYVLISLTLSIRANLRKMAAELIIQDEIVKSESK